MTRRVAIVQRLVPHYRADFFARLVARAAGEGFEVRIVHTAQPGRAPLPFPPYVTLPARLRWSGAVVGVEHTMVVPRGLWRWLRDSDPDLVVSEDISGFPTGLIVAASARQRRRPYLVWGLGRIAGRRSPAWRRPLEPAIAWFRRGAAGFLAYSRAGAAYYEANYGRPAIAVYNSTVDLAGVESVRADIASGARLSGPTRFAFIGSLKTQKRVDRLLRVLGRVAGEWALDIIGDGPELGELKALAHRLGLSGRVQFHGAVYDPAVKRAILTGAHVAVMPGLGGLMIQEAYACGLPVISGPSDGTELDLVRDVNPELFVESPDDAALEDAIRRFLAWPREARAAAALAALQAVEDHYNVDAMVDRFIAAFRRFAAPPPA